MEKYEKVSLLMLTIDRFEITKRCWEHNLTEAKKSGLAIETLVCDNGSTDRRIVEYFAGKVTYHRRNSRNEGCARSFNQLFLRSTGDVIVLLGNDILMPDRWLNYALVYRRKIPNCGIIGFDWGHGSVPRPPTWKLGVMTHWVTPEKNRVFGTWIVPRRVIEEIGFFYDGYGPYGIEDSDFNERVNLAGFNSFYVAGEKSQHLVHDVGEGTPYRRMKDESLQKNAKIFDERVRRFAEDGVREPLPPLRDPC